MHTHTHTCAFTQIFLFRHAPTNSHTHCGRMEHMLAGPNIQMHTNWWKNTHTHTPPRHTHLVPKGICPQPKSSQLLRRNSSISSVEELTKHIYPRSHAHHPHAHTRFERCIDPFPASDSNWCVDDAASEWDPSGNHSMTPSSLFLI